MRKLIVSNFQTLDGYYESADKTFDRFFDYFHEDYGANEAFDEYNTELTIFPPAGLAQAALHADLGRVRQHPCGVPAHPPRACAGLRERRWPGADVPPERAVRGPA